MKRGVKVWNFIGGERDAGDVALVENRRRFSRVGLVAALTVLVLGTFVSLEGVAMAATGKTVSQVSKKSNSAASDQYRTHKTIKPAPVAHVKIVKPKAQVAGATTHVKSGTLPFTGFSLLASVAIGVGLVGLGFILRRRDSRE